MRVQLKKDKQLKTSVTALTATLLGLGVGTATAQNQVESSLLLYSEKDRVTAAEGIISYSHQLSGDWLLGLKAAYDGLTGASPNGALPSRRIQTFTRPSGQGSYSIAPGVMPLDDTFKDTRFALDANLGKSVGQYLNLSGGSHFSTEHDYTSLGLNAGLSLDLNQKNTTLAFSTAYSRDDVRPEGGAPTPLTPMRTASGEDDDRFDKVTDDDGPSGPGKTKDVVDFVFAINQVLDRKTLLRCNYSFSRSTGYLTDPYKLLSVVGGPSSTNPGESESYVYEGRPDSRNKNALYAELMHYFGGDVVNVSYRFFWDDWKVKSHTVDFSYLWYFAGGKSIKPHVRWYHQSRADFYRLFLVSGESLPQHASADSRLADFDALTVGAQYEMPVGEHFKLNFAGEYYTQMGDNSPPEAFGAMKQFDLFPSMNAFMLRVGLLREF